MTWNGHSVAIGVWCAQPVLQSAVAFMFWRRKLNKQFPAFFLFLQAQVVIFAIIFPVFLRNNSQSGWGNAGYTSYFVLFWMSEAVNAFLGFKVIHEIFLDVFRPYQYLKDLGTLLFKWAGVVLLLVSVVVAFSNSFDQSPLVHAVTTLQRSVRIVQLGLILFMVLFSRFLGVSRKQISFGISLGFGLLAGVELMLMALNSGGFVRPGSFANINMATCDVAILVWLAYSMSRRPATLSTANRLQTQRWEQGLADLQNPVTSDSLIPMFEGMVERAFSRSSNLEQTENQVRTNSLNAPKASSAAVGSKSAG